MNRETDNSVPGARRQYGTLDADELTFLEIPGLIDYTMLKPEATIEEYARFLREAEKRRFRAVFVPPCLAPLAAGMLSATAVAVGVPISFPFGYCAPEVKAAEAQQALEDGAVELDVVMNVSAARSGEWDLVREDLEAVMETVRSWRELYVRDVPTRLILETPYLTDGQKVEACRQAEASGFDYVKTATGFGIGGATVEDVALMRNAVGGRMGVKAAGGIRTWAEARNMIAAGADLIGTSAGVQIIEDFINAAS